MRAGAVTRLPAAALLLAALLPGRAAWADPHPVSHPEASHVVAIGGAVTEIVYALGEQDRLVARDSTSVFPPEAMALPDIGYMRQLSPEGVLSVGPDLILAEDGAGPPEAVALLRAAGVAFAPIPSGYDAAGLDGKITAVAAALGVPEKAAPALAALRADLDLLAERKAGLGPKKRVMFILSLQDGRIMASGQGTAADEIIRLAGAENAVQGFQGYKNLSDEAATGAAPDVILMMNRGEATSQHGAPDDQLLAMPALASTPAAASRAVLRMDGGYLLGFGPRTGSAALALHDAIYPAP